MGYFTIVHWAFLVFYTLLFVALTILALKQAKRKILIPILFSNFLIISLLIVLTMFILDKYTKVAVLQNIVQQRVLLNETITFRGDVKNIGSFDISKCKLKIKLTSDPTSMKNFSEGELFDPTFGMGSRKGMKKPTMVEHVFTIAKDLKAGERRNFYVSMPYPPYFVKATWRYYLTCM